MTLVLFRMRCLSKIYEWADPHEPGCPAQQQEAPMVPPIAAGRSYKYAWVFLGVSCVYLANMIYYNYLKINEKNAVVI